MGWLMGNVFGLLGWGYAVLPKWGRSGVRRGLTRLLRAWRPRHDTVLKNLQMAYPGEDEASRRVRAEIEESVPSHLATLMLEFAIIFAPGDTYQRWIERNSRLVGIEHWKKAREKGRGVIILGSHVGNWEAMVAQFGLHLPDFMMVTKKLKPGWLHDRMQQGRSSCRVRATYEPKTLRDVLSQLKAGETVGIALDQYAGPPVGVRVPFLGACVGTHTLIALLVKRTGAAVVPVRCFREENGIYQVEFLPEVEWVEHENVHEENALNTARYAASMESMVRGHPRQWLWTHRRFKGDLSPLRPGEWGQGRVRK